VFGFHWEELVVVLLLALVFFGPKRLPEIGGALGQGIREFRKGTTELKDKAMGEDENAHVAEPPPEIPPVQKDREVT
jgi:sec-independent protein translocase protein TatA